MIESNYEKKPGSKSAVQSFLREKIRIVEHSVEHSDKDGFRNTVLNLAKKQGLSLEQFYGEFLEAQRVRCSYNFVQDSPGTCEDIKGKHLAFDLKEIATAFGKEEPLCREICKHRLCAYFNRLEVNAAFYFAEKYGNLLENLEENKQKAFNDKEV